MARNKHATGVGLIIRMHTQTRYLSAWVMNHECGRIRCMRACIWLWPALHVLSFNHARTGLGLSVFVPIFKRYF